ncbi:MAG: hypothetical protein HYY24_06035 [Verrucomicrobia bacterium]|nr:hypothetical protein [Verrucomicrobiota bacterium]
MRALALTTWFFFLASSVLGLLVMLYGCPSDWPGPGPGAPLEGLGVIYGIAGFAICLVVFVICLRERPRPESFTTRNWAVAITSYGTAVLGFWMLTHHVGRYNLTVRVVDSARLPMEGVSVEFTAYALGEGLGRLDRLAKGRTVTDSSGSVEIQSNHAHTLHLQVRKLGFRIGTIQLVAAGHRYPHQLLASELRVEAPSYAVPQSSNAWLIPAQENIALTTSLQKD